MTAKETYHQRLTSIQKSIEILKSKLTEHNKSFEKRPGNWGYVGDLGHIDENLKNLVKFLN